MAAMGPRFMPLSWVVAWRYMRGRRSRMLNSTARAALIATTLGVTAMVIAMALMTGYTEDLERKLIGLQAEIIVSPLTKTPTEEEEARLADAAALPGVVRMGRVSYGEGSVTSSTLPEGLAVTLRGVDPGGDATFDAAWQRYREDQLPPVVLGTELLRQLGVEEGDALRLVVLHPGETRVSFRYQSVRVGGTFTTGFAEFDSSWVVLGRATLERLRGGSGFNIVEIDLADSADTAQLTAAVEETLGPAYVVESWQRLNRELFAALALQEMLLFLVLGLIVVVSTFNVASTLVILVRERMRDIGVLGALGLTPRELWWVFVTYGLLLGALGTACGVAIGAGVSWVLTTFELVSFDPEVAAIYFIDSVPFRVELADVAAIVGFALTVTLAACTLPAYRASRILPAHALRYE